MEGKGYRNITTNEIVLEEDAKEYALTELGLMDNGKLVIVPRGKNGEYTLEQINNIQETVEWFFSGNWIEEHIKEQEYEEDYYAVKDDLIYESLYK